MAIKMQYWELYFSETEIYCYFAPRAPNGCLDLNKTHFIDLAFHKLSSPPIEL